MKVTPRCMPDQGPCVASQVLASVRKSQPLTHLSQGRLHGACSEHCSSSTLPLQHHAALPEGTVTWQSSPSRGACLARAPPNCLARPSPGHRLDCPVTGLSQGRQHGACMQPHSRCSAPQSEQVAIPQRCLRAGSQVPRQVPAWPGPHLSAWPGPHLEMHWTAVQQVFLEKAIWRLLALRCCDLSPTSICR